MREVDIQRRCAVQPAYPQHIAHGEKGVRAYQYATGAEKTVLGQPFDYPEMFGRDRGASQRNCRAGCWRQWFVLLHLRVAGNQLLHPDMQVELADVYPDASKQPTGAKQ